MKLFVRLVCTAAAVLLLPTLAFAQASIAGVVKDMSGAVLPGVTVEAASPALIEKTRSAVTDGMGQYQITNLAPGTYSVTFTLQGFNTVKREGIELQGSFVAKVDTELGVGALTETITVSGETPVVDVQSAIRERVLDREVLDTIPAGRNPFQMGVLIPGIVVTAGVQDVGGSGSTGGAQPGNAQLTIHGSGGTDGVIMQNGVVAADFSGNRHINPLGTNPTATQEVVIDTAAGSVEDYTGGVRTNVITRDGGNTLNATFVGSFTGSSLQSDNITDRLRALGATAGERVKSNYDINPGIGGPLKKDKLWFYFSPRWNRSDNYAANSFYNRNVNNPNVWTYDLDRSRQLSNNSMVKDAQLRLTYQASQRNKIGLVWHEEVNCFCTTIITPTIALEASENKVNPVQRGVALDYTSPVTTRLLLEAGAFYYFGVADWNPWPGLAKGMIAVTEQSTGLLYRSGDAGGNSYASRPSHGVHSRVALSYITGTHAIKVGYNDSTGGQDMKRTVLQPVAYRFNNGVPNQIREFGYGEPNNPLSAKTNIPINLGLFAQDKWTIKRMVLMGGVRFDWFKSSSPEQTVTPALLAPTRNITFPATDGLNWKDISPRISAAYDVSGKGKTAVKFSIGKYLQGLGPQTGIVDVQNPATSLVTSTTRSWTDANRDFVPNCDLLVAAANGECGAIADPLFGSTRPGTVYDPSLLSGWSKRGYNWELGLGVQHELLPRVSMEASYYRRWFGNFILTDNLTLSAADYDTFSITAPRDPALPDGGGQVISGLLDLKPARFGLPSNSIVKLASEYGNQTQYWHGVDLTVNARPRGGVMLQGGLSTGRTVTDNCEIVKTVPESLLAAAGTAANIAYCHSATGWKGGTQLKFLGSYSVPKIDVRLSGTYQSLPGPALVANYTATNAVVAPSLGRPLAGGAANVTVNVIEPGTVYGDRLHQIDWRISKIFRVNPLKYTFNFDVYNLLNADTVLSENPAYASFRRPTNILQGRLIKFGFQVDF